MADDSFAMLWKIQELEREQAQIKAQLRSSGCAEAEALAAGASELQQKLKEQRRRLAELQHEVETGEHELEFMGNEAKTLESRLYSGTVNAAKELEQLQQQVDRGRQDVAAREEAVYSCMEEVDGMMQQIKVTSREIEARESRCNVLRADNEAKLDALHARWEGIEARRKQLAGAVKAEVWEKYQVLKQTMPQPLAKVENGICSGCRLGVPEGQLTSNANRLVYCDNCGRLIFRE